MKKVLLLLLGIFVQQVIQAQTLHALFVADTKDPLLSTACQRDLEVMHRQCTQIASALRVRLNEQTLSGDALNRSNLNRLIDSLKVEPQDVIFFYYSGHGYNESKRNDAFPLLYLHKEAAERSQNPSLKALHTALKTKKARLCISFGDCCNNLSNNTRGMVGRKPLIRGLTLTNDSLNAAYRKLFGEASGDVLIASSQPPQTSCAHADSGSYYTRAFDEALELASRYNRSISWQALLKDTQGRLNQHVATRDRKSIYEIHLSGQPSAVVTDPKPDFQRINQYLNALTDVQRPQAERYALLTQVKEYFTKKARIDIYVNTTLGEVQPIEQVIQRLYLNAGKIQRINLIERLSTVSADGVHYERAAIQEIW